jgi:hypothetical protein
MNYMYHDTVDCDITPSQVLLWMTFTASRRPPSLQAGPSAVSVRQAVYHRWLRMKPLDSSHHFGYWAQDRPLLP